MLIQKQIVFLAYADTTTGDGDRDIRIFSDRSDAMRFTNGDASKILPRTVIPSTGIGRYRKPLKPVKKAARARR